MWKSRIAFFLVINCMSAVFFVSNLEALPSRALLSVFEEPDTDTKCECTTNPTEDGRCEVNCFCDNIHGPNRVCSDISHLDSCVDSPSLDPNSPDYEPSIPNVTCTFDDRGAVLECRDRDNDNQNVCDQEPVY